MTSPITRSVPEIIAAKRDGLALSDAEIRRVVEDFTRSDLPDYQMSALAMAIFFRGMTPEETTALTLAMRDSGKVVAQDTPPGLAIDKHSTGGVGDKISICLAPLVAACGVYVPMVSGRGLGHSGGTLDKLEAIPGFRVDMPVDVFITQVRELGCALIGQTAEIAPADKRLYALRDVTATVESIPLITASILSKKLAEGIDGLVLDVKVGKGAFMKTLDDARALSASLVRVGSLAGKRVSALLTAMESPLGRAIGHGLETIEAFEVLHGRGPADVVELTMALGAEMLRLAGIAEHEADAHKKLHDAIESGAAAERMRRVVAAQGGDPRVVDDPTLIASAPIVVPVRARSAGFVHGIDALELGSTVVALGGGRKRADDVIDPAVGIVLKSVVGDRVEQDDVLAELHISKREHAGVAERVVSAYELRAAPPKAAPLVIEIIRG